MDDIKIDKFEVSGNMTKEAEEALRARFPKIDIYLINDRIADKDDSFYYNE